MEQNSCAFTGYRPHKFPWKANESDPMCVALKAVLKKEIIALSEAGITYFYSGCADGTDAWASLIVLSLREKNPALQLHCVLPCEGQADKWEDCAQKRYHFILSQADSVEYVSRQYYDGCMLDRNHRMVEAAGTLLAVYNGARRSGTGATVNYARKLGRKIIMVDPITLNITR